MLSEETTKKLWIWGMAAIVLIAAFWLIFVVFFNQGWLAISGKAPFTVVVGNVKTESCSESPCTITLSPGEYSIEIQKEDHKTEYLDAEVPMGGIYEHEVEFTFREYVALLGEESSLNYFNGAPPAELDLPRPYFIGDSYAVYLLRNRETGRQTLYYTEIVNGKADEPQIATSFIRDLTDYQIYSFIELSQKIVIVDKSRGRSVLYLIDLKEKTRDNILDYPLIDGVKWLDDSPNFLFEARDEDSVSTSVFYYDGAAGEAKKLPLKTSLSNVVMLNSENLLAATDQNANGVAANNSLEGQLITLGESAASGEVKVDLFTDDLNNVPSAVPVTNFVQYDMTTGNLRLILSESGLSGVEEIKLGPDKKSALVLAGGKVYEMRFDR